MTRNQQFGIGQLFDEIYPVGTKVQMVGIKGEPLTDTITSQTYMVGAECNVDTNTNGRVLCTQIVGPLKGMQS